jgi:hypothetical protein
MKKAYKAILESHLSLDSLISLPFPIEDSSVIPSEDAMTMPLAALKFTSILTAFKLTIRTAQTEKISELTMLAGPPIIEVALVLVLILELYLAHVIQAAIPEGSSLAGPIVSHCRLEAVAKRIIIDAMSIGLIINELTDE